MSPSFLQRKLGGCGVPCGDNHHTTRGGQQGRRHQAFSVVNADKTVWFNDSAGLLLGSRATGGLDRNPVRSHPMVLRASSSKPRPESNEESPFPHEFQHTVIALESNDRPEPEELCVVGQVHHLVIEGLQRGNRVMTLEFLGLWRGPRRSRHPPRRPAGHGGPCRPSTSGGTCSNGRPEASVKKPEDALLVKLPPEQAARDMSSHGRQHRVPMAGAGLADE